MRHKTVYLGAVAVTSAFVLLSPLGAAATTGTITFHTRPNNKRYEIVDPGDDHCYGLGDAGGEVINDTPLDLVLWSSRDCTGRSMATVPAGRSARMVRYGSLQLDPASAPEPAESADPSYDRDRDDPSDPSDRRDSGDRRDPEDQRDYGDHRDPADSRDEGDSRYPGDVADPRDPVNSRDGGDSRDEGDSRYPGDVADRRDPADSRDRRDLANPSGHPQDPVNSPARVSTRPAASPYTRVPNRPAASSNSRVPNRPAASSNSRVPNRPATSSYRRVPTRPVVSPSSRVPNRPGARPRLTHRAIPFGPFPPFGVGGW
ncbi:chitin-binding protein [Streptomyces sp. NPDC020742]|uniref:chitin-binding protein n=1 Tax=unclassified Streptomyces TaxID=2593676 RepID=UPI0033FB9ED3